jgi:hypothetical protein
MNLLGLMSTRAVEYAHHRFWHLFRQLGERGTNLFWLQETSHDPDVRHIVQETALLPPIVKAKGMTPLLDKLASQTKPNPVALVGRSYAPVRLMAGCALCELLSRRVVLGLIASAR